MSIEPVQRKRGTGYRVRIMRDGQSFSQTFRRRYEAEKFARRIEEHGSIIVETELTFAQAAEQWLSNHAVVCKTPASIATDRWILTKHILPVLGAWKLRKITVRQIEDLIAALRKTGMANSSVRRNLDVLKAICNYFVRRQVLLTNPMTALGRFKVDEVDFRFWTQEEAIRFLEYTAAKYRGTPHEVYYLLYRVALHTGMRLGEMLALKWSAIDFENRLIKVCRSFCGVSKQIRETTKSRKIRHVPLSAAIFDDLQVVYAKRECELVFHRHGQVLDKSNLRNRHFDPDIRSAGVAKIKFHDMRHTYASHFVMAGGNIYALQAILGHGDVRMTGRYAHFGKAFFAEKADIVRFDGGKVIHADFVRKPASNAV